MKCRAEIGDALRRVTPGDGFWSRLVERNRAAALAHVRQQREDEGK